MKTSFVSTYAISNAMRYSQSRLQVELVQAQKESSTGRVADRGLALGARTAQSVSLERDLARLNGLVDSNTLVSSRLASTQNSLIQLSGVAQTFLTALTSMVSGDSGTANMLTSAKAALADMTSIMNSSLNGEHLFAGTNTDVQPINDFVAGSPAKTAFDTAFVSYFGFAQTAPAAAGITTAQMDAFMAANVEPQFLGTGWETNWSNATQQPIMSRITLNETTQTSVGPDNEGMRKLAMATATVSDLFAGNLSEEAKTALVKRAISLVGESLADLADLQASTGIIQKRVSDATDRIKMQADLFEKHILDTEGVDPYEAATRVSNLLSQIETSYALTARMQQLSLLRFLT